MRVFLCMLLSAQLAFAEDGGTPVVPYADPDAGIWEVEGAKLRDGGEINQRGFFLLPERITRIAQANEALRGDNQKLQTELENARAGRPLFASTFWAGMAIGTVLTVLVVGGSAIWISSSRK